MHTMPGSDSLSTKLLASRTHQRDYSPVSWSEYFDEAHDIELNDSEDITNEEQIQSNSNQTDVGTKDSFRIYLRNFKPPLAPEREFAQTIKNCDLTKDELYKYLQIPTLVMLHGGGYSALTWAQFTQSIEQLCRCRILAIDLRGHGDTKTRHDEQMDIDTLVSDVIQVTHAAHRICGFPETPKIVLIGHSMGGAIAVKCSMRCTESMPSLAGFVVIDVVEGTAKDALPLMMSVINTRPTKFPTLSNAIEWSIRSGMAKNPYAARVSMPGNLLTISTGNLSIHDVELNSLLRERASNIKKHKFHISLDSLLTRVKYQQTTSPLPKGLPVSPRIASLRSNPSNTNLPVIQSTVPSNIGPLRIGESIIEEQLNDSSETSVRDSKDTLDETNESSLDRDGYKKPPKLQLSGYCWRTNLAKTQPFWNGWFDGLSEQLLAAPVQGKFLLLAGIDRLDKTLTIGQMQGKFMMKVLPKCGHAVHEDVPEQVASVIGQFIIRNKFTTTAD